jgi:hypothetical protein
MDKPSALSNSMLEERLQESRRTYKLSAGSVAGRPL